MENRERELESKGYKPANKMVDSNDESKNYAKDLRKLGYKATVVSESRRGVYYYSVWYK